MGLCLSIIILAVFCVSSLSVDARCGAGIGGRGCLAPFPAKPVFVFDPGSFVEHVKAFLPCVDGTYDFVVSPVERRGGDVFAYQCQ
jgi:hypothetical protein